MFGCVVETEFFCIMYTYFVHESLKNYLLLNMALSGTGFSGMIIVSFVLDRKMHGSCTAMYIY